MKTSNHLAVFDLFHHKVMASTDPDVKQGKPAPDIFLVAASRFPDNPDPSQVSDLTFYRLNLSYKSNGILQCLVFEDAPNGMIGARAAGMQVVLVPDPNVAESQRKGATLVLKSLNEVKLEDFGLPPFDK